MKLLFLFLFLILLNSCASTLTLTSEFNDNTVKIDGNADDWEGDLFAVHNTPLGIGVKNDADNVYLCIINGNNSTTKNILRNGLFVWFDEKGRKTKRIGLKYPLTHKPDFKITENRNETPPPDGINMIPLINPEFEYYVGEDHKILLPCHNNDKNIEIELARGYNKLVWELKIPFDVILQKSQKRDLKKLGIGLEIPEINKGMMNRRPDMGQQPHGGSGPGNLPNRRGGTPPGGMARSGGRYRQNNSSSDQVKKWIKIKFAEN